MRGFPINDPCVLNEQDVQEICTKCGAWYLPPENHACKEKWKIWISGGYGLFDFVGTETEAEEMRVHKARWEHGSGWKYRIENQAEVDRLTQEVVELWDAGKGVPQSMFTKILAAKQRPTQEDTHD